ncbi:methionine gamma-lyase [Fervidibacillus halotolerans]|uniref:L-methionine gamma-lyase n=2 Tax=Fervidibacillus halotolerans TaxID=2980027 RepID=A0A9E8S036_9BACI|nr:methionine gamma-lyase [Fervidibacillus halotolerans]WAA14013.1 methionine gamma-lyase [Fervidibacillus halotolerans]
MLTKDMHVDTLLIHSGYDSRENRDSLSPPLYHSSTFTFESAEQGERRFSGEEDGNIYSRLANPTVRILEERMAILEKGEGALAFGSGMAAVSAVLFHLTKTGDHILSSRGIYGCTFALLEMLEEKYHIEHTFSPLQSAEEIESSIRENTACIYVETPINPTMEMIDLELVTSVAKRHGIPVVVDNTFSSPYLQNPLEIGADYVVHSATKYISGHGDVIGGVLIGKNKEELEMIRSTTRKDIGGIMSPFDAWLLLRGLKTLHVRMERHVENAKKIASYLKKHPLVEKIYYPGDEESSQYPIMQKQMKAPGGILSFTIRGGKNEAQAFMNQLKLIKIAVSLGDAETLIQHPATMTHAVVPLDARLNMGITENMLRLSVGLENPDDLIDDLKQAFSSIKKEIVTG